MNEKINNDSIFSDGNNGNNDKSKDKNKEDKIYEFQVGGHGLIRQTNEGILVKPTNLKEVEFYRYVNGDKSPKFLRKVTPQVYNIHNMNCQNNIIQMENVNNNIKKPCILDLKIGTRYYDNDATPEKKRRMKKKSTETTSAKTGLQIVAMQVYKSDDIIEKRDKYHGKKIVVDDLINEIKWFFQNIHGIVRYDAVNNILHKVECLVHHMSSFEEYNFYSSSILICYDASCDSDDGSVVEVRMIDFAHTVPVHGDLRNDGYVFGVRYLVQVLKSIRGLYSKITL